jgi:hypothetical protein
MREHRRCSTTWEYIQLKSSQADKSKGEPGIAIIDRYRGLQYGELNSPMPISIQLHLNSNASPPADHITSRLSLVALDLLLKATALHDSATSFNFHPSSMRTSQSRSSSVISSRRTLCHTSRLLIAADLVAPVSRNRRYVRNGVS